MKDALSSLQEAGSDQSLAEQDKHLQQAECGGASSRVAELQAKLTSYDSAVSDMENARAVVAGQNDEAQDAWIGGSQIERSPTKPPFCIDSRAPHAHT
jgi:hypothetical protein